MHRLCYLAPILPFTVLFAAAPAPLDTPTFSLERRVPLVGSRVVGWPDPPPPYRTRRVFSQYAFRAPVYLASHPAHDLVFVVEQNGRIVHVPTSGKGAVEEFVRIADADTYGMTFHPRYQTNRWVYVFSNGPNSAKKKKNQILRYTTKGNPPRCDPASRQLVIEWESNGHNGGDLGFGPDGMLYITAGDGTSDSDTDMTGQDLRDLCSGVLRLDVDNPPPGKSHAVPADNPFVKVKDARPELWAFGFRNPWRMTFDPNTGDLLVGDVGQDLWEMIRLVRKGSNHGWSVTEGSNPFQPLRTKGPGPIVPPLIEHPHSESRSITGGIVYQGKKFPDLRGVYVYGDYSTGKIWGLKHSGGKVTWKKDLAQTRLQIVGFGADREGELYVVDVGGQIHTLEPSPPVKGPSIFPRKLSESGLFLSVKEHRLHPALIPYSVNSPLWSDGAFKERAMGVPRLEPVGFTEQGPWQFPDETVLVKTFSLDLADGSRRRIETRLLTRQQGEWYGYSYAWDDNQNDAVLVESGGMDRTYTVRDGAEKSGKRELPWRYPSRMECMVCHTRAANYVLGVTTAQLNREHDYPGVRMNQLQALQQIPFFQVSRLDHWKQLDEPGKLLADVLRQAGRSGPLSPVGKCCLEPWSRKVQERQQEITKALEKKGESTQRLVRRPGDYSQLIDPGDSRAEVEKRVRSYLQANCAHCHVWAGGGNSAIDLHINTERDKMKLIGEKPLHDRFGIPDALLVAPGQPERSVLYQRLSRRGKGQMPPLATHQVDEQARELLRHWILGLK